VGGVRCDLGVAKGARRVADQLLLVGQREVHAGDPSRVPDHKKSRRAGGAFVHLTDRPLQACAFNSHSARLRPTRAPRSAGAAIYAVRAPMRKRARTRNFAYSEISSTTLPVRAGSACLATSAWARMPTSLPS